MKKCDCYETVKRLRYVTFDDEYHYEIDGICNGTKERDVCGCNGDRTNCSFYPEVREKARNETTIQDTINFFKYGIDHDIFGEALTTHARIAVEALKKQIALKTLERDYIPNGTLVYGHCPKCDTFTDNHEEYCYKCGQKLDWS